MKRKLSLLGVACLAALLCFTLLSACSPKPPTEVRINGGPAGGAKPMRMEGVAEAIRRSNPEWNVRMVSGPVTIASLNMMARGEMEVEVLSPDTILDCTRGILGEQKLEAGPMNMVVLSPSHSARAAIVVLAKLPVNSIAEVRDKQYPLRIAVGPEGCDFEIRNKRILEAYGITYDDIRAWGGKIIFQADSPTIELMRDGLADGFVNFGTHPSARFEELATTRELKLLTVSDPAAIEWAKEYGYTPTVIEKGTYGFMTQDQTTVERMESLITIMELDSKIAYDIARGIWENRSYLYKVHPLFEETLQPDVIPKWAQEMEGFGIDLNPGALKYYEEQGLIK